MSRLEKQMKLASDNVRGRLPLTHVPNRVPWTRGLMLWRAKQLEEAAAACTDAAEKMVKDGVYTTAEVLKLGAR